jgi:hypothetical protein
MFLFILSTAVGRERQQLRAVSRAAAAAAAADNNFYFWSKLSTIGEKLG